MNSYDLSRNWFNWCFENPEKIKPNHTALYFFCIEHCNRMGWKEKFGLPTTMAKEAIGISSYNTYINTLKDLVEWGFIRMIEKSQNQYSSNIIALSKFDKALDKPLDKALIKHGSKQSESIDSIDKQVNNITSEQINNLSDSNEPAIKKSKQELLEERKLKFKRELNTYLNNPYPLETIKAFSDYWTEADKNYSKMLFEKRETFEIKLRLQKWANNDYGKIGTNNESSIKIKLP